MLLFIFPHRFLLIVGKKESKTFVFDVILKAKFHSKTIWNIDKFPLSFFIYWNLTGGEIENFLSILPKKVKKRSPR